MARVRAGPGWAQGNGTHDAYAYADWDGWDVGWEEWEEAWKEDAWWSYQEPRAPRVRRVLPPSGPAWVSQSSSELAPKALSKGMGKGKANGALQTPPGLEVSYGKSRPDPRGKEGKEKGKAGGKAGGKGLKGKKEGPERATGGTLRISRGTPEGYNGQEKGRTKGREKGKAAKGGDSGLGLSHDFTRSPRVSLEGAIGSRSVAPPAPAPARNRVAGGARVVGLPIGAKPQDYVRSASSAGQPGDSNQDEAAWRPTVNKIRKERVSQEISETGD